MVNYRIKVIARLIFIAILIGNGSLVHALITPISITYGTSYTYFPYNSLLEAHEAVCNAYTPIFGKMTPDDPSKMQIYCSNTRFRGIGGQNVYVLVSCPANSRPYGNSQCVCTYGGTIYAGNDNCADPCPVEPLTPITEPEALNMENNVNARVREDRLTDDMKQRAACLKKEALALGVQVSVTSGYRPQGYQSHIYEVFEKYNAFEVLKDKAKKEGYSTIYDRYPSCYKLYFQVKKEKEDNHKLQGKVAQSASKHKFGEAFDASWDKRFPQLTPKVDQAAEKCGLYRPFPLQDRVHFERKPG